MCSVAIRAHCAGKNILLPGRTSMLRLPIQWVYKYIMLSPSFREPDSVSIEGKKRVMPNVWESVLRDNTHKRYSIA